MRSIRLLQEHNMSLTLSSAAFENGREIPSVHTCEGGDISPPLSWSEVPPETRSLALIVDDPDAPDPAKPQRVFTHWVLYNIPPNADGLPQGAQADNLPPGAHQGTNGWGRIGFGGPCPPIGRHRYFHKLYALDTVLPDLGDADKATLEQAMQGHVVAQTELIGLYQKH
jgi:Raf kinase inhibitor-like YbhB/YbcL family protein